MQVAEMLMRTSTSKVGENTRKINYSLTRVNGFHGCCKKAKVHKELVANIGKWMATNKIGLVEFE
jgi:hypothetical protein